MILPRLAVTLLVVGVLTAACGGGDSTDTTKTTSSAATRLSPSSSPAAVPDPIVATPKPGPERAPSTPKLDSIVALGHSGTTGYGSDPSQPNADVRENSWVTGSNPAVDSIYQRLLATHPALKGHATSLGQDGSTVDDLPGQVTKMLALNPLPDVVVIQGIDNDMQCDGTDPANQKRYSVKLGKVLDTINQQDRYAQIYLIDQPISVQTWTDATKHLPDSVNASTGTDPCDTFSGLVHGVGKERPAGIASEQRIVDGYFDVVKRVCAEHRNCFTDRGQLQQMPLNADWLSLDQNHFLVPGQAALAKYAWDAMPDAIKNRP